MKIVCGCGNDDQFTVEIIKDYSSDYGVGGWGIEGFEVKCDCGKSIEINTDGISYSK
ncbi:hypothetical protein [Paenibacillus cremeus]|uniref:hypothetical protein n=1 Tax=Paenibacillus cremeus TaxID=2163881 RepID=UPI001645C753|nr:hypothetical protein [Paenibacillus cremeus]